MRTDTSEPFGCPHIEEFSLWDAGIVENTYNDHRAFFTLVEAKEWNQRIDNPAHPQKAPAGIPASTVNDGMFAITVREPERVLDL